MAETKPQRELGESLERDAGICLDLLNVVPDLLFTIATKILVTKIIGSKLCIGPYFSGEAALIERHARDHADVMRAAVWEQLVFGRSIEDVVDDLHCIDQAGCKPS